MVVGRSTTSPSPERRRGSSLSPERRRGSSLSPERRATSPSKQPAPAKGSTASPQVKDVWGAYKPHKHLSTQNLINAFLFCIAMIPSVVFTWWLYGRAADGCELCTSEPAEEGETNLMAWLDHMSISPYLEWLDHLQAYVITPASTEPVCEAWVSELLTRPLLTAHLLFFVNVSVGFWLVGLAQRSFWLIDPYWTILPPLLAHFYRAHPCAIDPAPLRGDLSLALIWVWSIRLTHSYFRREGWKFGEREDWRYTKMAEDLPRSWWLVSFFAVGLAQQPVRQRPRRTPDVDSRCSARLLCSRHGHTGRPPARRS